MNVAGLEFQKRHAKAAVAACMLLTTVFLESNGPFPKKLQKVEINLLVSVELNLKYCLVSIR